MTKGSDMIYCVQCLSLQPHDKADLMFRTGYYRVTVPLGRCVTCANAERTAAVPRPKATDEGNVSSGNKLA
jgi:hypothetical protein